MKTCELMTLTFLLFFGAISLVSPQDREAVSVAQASENPPAPQPLTFYLLDLGVKYDCFFTLEDAWKEGELADRLESRWIQKYPAKESLQQELDELSRIIPNFRYEFNEANPRLVHIMDARLPQQEGYALERSIDRIEFEGKVNELVTAISKQGIPISPPLAMFTHETRDHSTEVRVKGEVLKVRDALSNFVPLGRRGRVIWIARTRLGQREVSYVYYP